MSSGSASGASRISSRCRFAVRSATTNQRLGDEEKPLPFRYLNYKQAAAYLAMPIGTLRSLVSHRKIPHAPPDALMLGFGSP